MSKLFQVKRVFTLKRHRRPGAQDCRTRRWRLRAQKRADYPFAHLLRHPLAGPAPGYRRVAQLQRLGIKLLALDSMTAKWMSLVLTQWVRAVRVVCADRVHCRILVFYVVYPSALGSITASLCTPTIKSGRYDRAAQGACWEDLLGGQAGLPALYSVVKGSSLERVRGRALSAVYIRVLLCRSCLVEKIVRVRRTRIYLVHCTHNSLYMLYCVTALLRLRRVRARRQQDVAVGKLDALDRGRLGPQRRQQLRRLRTTLPVMAQAAVQVEGSS